MMSATSFTMGADTRKEKVTPSGTPASINPMKRGTAEQEQNGVTMPSRAARILPINTGSFSRTRFVLLFGREEAPQE